MVNVDNFPRKSSNYLAEMKVASRNLATSADQGQNGFCQSGFGRFGSRSDQPDAQRL